MPAIIGTFTDYDGLIALLRERKAELGLSDLGLDEIAGLCSGHAGKLLGPRHVKGLGVKTLTLVMGALGLKGVLIVDDAQTERILRRIQPRDERRVRHQHEEGPVTAGPL